MSDSEGERTRVKDIISHNHPLVVQVLREFTSDANKPPRRCEACKEEIFSGHYYTCASSSSELECNFFMHKCCGDLYFDLQHHPLHSQHTLFIGYFNVEWSFTCHACLDEYKGLTYYCMFCECEFDIGCITLKERKIKHKFHEHQLTPQRRPTLTLCNACGIKHEGVFYQCTKCVCYWIHRDCASLPETITHTHHVHSLDLCYTLPQNLSPWNSCNICMKRLYPSNKRVHIWVYYCKGCRYVAHVNCAASKIEPFMQILLPPTSVESRNVYINPNALRFPMEGLVNELANVSMIKRFLTDKDDDDSNNKETTITHWSHPHHLLILHEEPLFGENGSPFARKSFVLNKCDGCGGAIIASPFWRCSESECHFFLHKCCGELRHSILGHPSHDPQHQLVLRTKPLEFFRAFRCGCCREVFNGIAYQCEEESCKFYMDVECAAATASAPLPSTAIIHEAHPHHQLVLKIWSTHEHCNCCSYYLNPSESRYGCETCKFNLHVRCVMYPSSVNHRFDKHPFRLTYVPLESQKEDDSYCEICEKFINPLKWFYSCPDCDRFMHPSCLFSIGKLYRKLNYFEYSQDYKVDCHPHQLSSSCTEQAGCDHCDQKDATLQQQGEEDQQEDEEYPTIQPEHKKDPSEWWLVYQCTQRKCKYRIQARCAISCNLRKGKKQLFNKLFPQLP